MFAKSFLVAGALVLVVGASASSADNDTKGTVATVSRNGRIWMTSSEVTKRVAPKRLSEDLANGVEFVRPHWMAVLNRDWQSQTGRLEYHWVELTEDTKVVVELSKKLPQRNKVGLSVAPADSPPAVRKGIDTANMRNDTWHGTLESFQLVEMKLAPSKVQPEFKGKKEFEDQMVRTFQTDVQKAAVYRAVEIRVVGYLPLPFEGVKFLPRR